MRCQLPHLAKDKGCEARQEDSLPPGLLASRSSIGKCLLCQCPAVVLVSEGTDRRGPLPGSVVELLIMDSNQDGRGRFSSQEARQLKARRLSVTKCIMNH